MILSFQTDRPWQTVQTQIRLLLEQSDQGLHCLQFWLHLLDALLFGKAILSKGGGVSKSAHAWIFLLVSMFDILDLTTTKYISVKTCRSQESTLRYSPFLVIPA